MWTSSGLVLVPGGTDEERIRGHFLEAVTVEKVFKLVPSSIEVIARFLLPPSPRMVMCFLQLEQKPWDGCMKVHRREGSGSHFQLPSIQSTPQPIQQLFSHLYQVWCLLGLTRSQPHAGGCGHKEGRMRVLNLKESQTGRREKPTHIPSTNYVLKNK